MDPNLLPIDLRGKEDKEQARLKKQPVGFGLELKLPEKNKKHEKAAKAPGIWSGLFGSKPKPVATEKLTVPPADFSHARSVDLLTSGKQVNKSSVSANRPGKNKKSGWLKNILGQPVSPVMNYAPEEKKSVPTTRVYEPKPAVKPDIAWRLPAQNRAKDNKPASRPKAGDSWTEIFKNMFSIGRKKRIDFRLASAGDKKELIAPAPPVLKQEAKRETAPAKEFVPYHAVTPRHNPPVETKNTHSEANSAKYHTAPKREKNAEVNVNLMPQELMSRLSSGSAGNIKSIVIAVIIPLAIISLGYGAIMLLQNNLESKMSERQGEFEGLQKQIGDFVSREKQNNQVADQVVAVKKLMDEKIIWKVFFADLEKYTLDGVYFTSLTADTSGVLTLPGVADDYDTLAKQLAALRDASDFVKDVKLTNAQLISEGKSGVIGVGFQLRLTLQDNIFKKPKSIK